jgi:hypothetical protein
VTAKAIVRTEAAERASLSDSESPNGTSLIGAAERSRRHAGDGRDHRGQSQIDAARLLSHQRQPYGLLAWSLRDPALQRHDARLMAAAFAADGA